MSRSSKPKIKAVYIIRNKANGKCYVGGTARDLRSRLSLHNSLLRAGKHYCDALQLDYDIYGADGFEFESYLQSQDRWEIKRVEQTLIEKLRSEKLCYNGNNAWAKREKKVNIYTRIPKSLYVLVESLAKKKNLKLADTISHILSKHFEAA